MTGIEGQNITNGMSLKKIRITFLLFFIVSCSTSFNVMGTDEKSLNGLYRNFIQVDKLSFTISTPYKFKDSKNIGINQSDSFRIVSTSISEKGSTIKISKTTDKIFQGITISFLDDTNTLRKIQVNFYSRLINIFQISDGHEIIYDKANDVVPPLFITTSLQIGKFTVCENDRIIFEFELLKDLYYFSLRAKNGDYLIGEVDCNKPYFSLLVR